jgi:hypothetical protein
MSIQALECPHCGAPIAPTISKDLVVCAYCHRTLVGVPGASWGMALRAADEALDPSIDPRRAWTIAGRRYVVAGRLASGESSDVFAAERTGRVRERVIVKVLRTRDDADLIEREWRAVHSMHESQAQGAPFFSTLLPQPVGRGKIEGHVALVYRWRSGFVHTLADVLRAFPGGVDPRAAVWMWRRTLELLGWVHASGWVHGAVLPRHLLVHARDHGVVLCGWSCASANATSVVPAIVDADRALYPPSAAAPATAALDVAMAARCIAHVLGGDASALPSSVPAPLAEIVLAFANARRTDDAWVAKERVAAAAVECFGPSRYVPFEMPTSF